MSNCSRPRCIVTGGSGFIGSHLVETLLEYGWDVTVLDIREPKININWLKLDIREDMGDLLQGYEFVFHLAAVANARKCNEDPVLCNSVNVMGTLNLLRAAHRAKVKRFVLASSSWVTGNQVGDVVNEKSLFDLSKLNTIYGFSKLTQENMCVAYKAEFGNPDYTILRYATPFGEGMWKGLVVRAFLETASLNKEIHIMGDGKQSREFLYVKDLCKAHISLLDDKTANKIYNLTGDSPISIEAIAQEIIKYYPAKIKYIPQSRVEPKFAMISNERAKHELNWQIETSLSTGIKKCFNWWDKASDIEKLYNYWC